MKVGFKRYNTMQDRYKEFIDNNKLSKNNKKILWAWVKDRQANNYSDKNNLGLIGTIRDIGLAIKKDYQKTTKTDLQDYFSSTKMKTTTELWYKKCLKRFYSWLSNHFDQSDLFSTVAWINTKDLSRKTHHQSTKKREDNLLSPEEVRKMIARADLLRDKLAIALLADTGVRAETIGASHNKRSINCGQIYFHKGYAEIKDIEEKFDKKRDIIVTEALSYLIKYWNQLPDGHRNNPKKPLFIGYSSNRRGARWGYAGLKDMLHRISKETLNRKINPHDFRHLKATRLHLDEELSDDSKCKLMGWSSRRMLDRYNHTTYNDAKAEYLQKKGIIKIEKGKKRAEALILKPKECLVCKKINNSSDTVCETCGNTLDYENIIKHHLTKKQQEEHISKFIEPKQIKDLFKVVYKLQKQLDEVKNKK